MDWTNFPTYAYISGVLWILSALFATLPSKKIQVCGNEIVKFTTKIGSFLPTMQVRKKMIITNLLSIIGLLVMGAFITIMWMTLGRPPLRTLGETRMWYAFFLPLIGIITYNRWKFGWFVGYTSMLAIVFLIINLAHPENFNKTLMPALQSPWFVPHVIVYIFSYAMLGVSSLVALYGLIQLFLRNVKDAKSGRMLQVQNYINKLACNNNIDRNKLINNSLNLADNLVYTGFAFLTLGLIFGALWAKEAWGHYWTWAPKETWAMLTYLMYLIYIHFRIQYPKKAKIHLWILSVSFAILLLAWFGVNYMPSSQNSVHTYTQSQE